MINPEFLAILRCPMDPQRDTPLVLEEGLLFCSRCRLRFPTRDGLPNLVVEEAELPAGCDSLSQLPCQTVAASKSLP